MCKMARRKQFDETQKKRKQEWISHTIDKTFKQEAQATQFDQMLDRLGLIEANCTPNAEVAAWIRTNRNTRYVPERVLRTLRCRTMFDEGDLAPYSLTESGMVIEPLPMQEVRDEQTITQE